MGSIHMTTLTISVSTTTLSGTTVSEIFVRFLSWLWCGKREVCICVIIPVPILEKGMISKYPLPGTGLIKLPVQCVSSDVRWWAIKIHGRGRNHGIPCLTIFERLCSIQKGCRRTILHLLVSCYLCDLLYLHFDQVGDGNEASPHYPPPLKYVGK